MNNLLKDMKLLNEDHTPDGFPAVKMSEINGLIEIIEKQSIQLAKANERVRELEQTNLELAVSAEACCELTEMDMGSAVERLFEIDNTESAELVNKFAIEKKIEFKNDLIKHLRNNYTWTHLVYEFIDSFGEQLRKEQDSE